MAQTVCPFLSAEDRVRLVAISADPNARQKHAQRARIILASADGANVTQVAQRTGATRPAVWRWQQRFAEQGVDGLLRDKTRKPGRKPISAEQVSAVLAMTESKPPGAAKRWTGRAMAEATGLSLRTVQRLWAAHGFQPHIQQVSAWPDKIIPAPRSVQKGGGQTHSAHPAVALTNQNERERNGHAPRGLDVPGSSPAVDPLFGMEDAEGVNPEFASNFKTGLVGPRNDYQPGFTGVGTWEQFVLTSDHRTHIEDILKKHKAHKNTEYFLMEMKSAIVAYKSVKSLHESSTSSEVIKDIRSIKNSSKNLLEKFQKSSIKSRQCIGYRNVEYMMKVIQTTVNVLQESERLPQPFLKKGRPHISPEHYLEARVTLAIEEILGITRTKSRSNVVADVLSATFEIAGISQERSMAGVMDREPPVRAYRDDQGIMYLDPV